jgi:hypothetical protein
MTLAFQNCQSLVRPGKYTDPGMADLIRMPGMHVVQGNERREYFVQSLRDIENGTRNGLRLYVTRDGCNVSYDGRPLNWQSPEAKYVHTAMYAIAKGLSRCREIPIASPMP